MVEKLRNMGYPGRVIILGADQSNNPIAIYAITGRSPSSQARIMEIGKSHRIVYVRPTDEKTIKEGNIDLLIYKAIISGKWVAVSNGKQTDDIFNYMLATSEQVLPRRVLIDTLKNWEYEPDAPNFTPRINGVINLQGNLGALGIIKKQDDNTARDYYEFALQAGQGKLIATYIGHNVNPLPSFKGEPLDVELKFNCIGDAVAAVCDFLAPKEGMPDFRVSVAGYSRTTNGPMISIKNRHQR